MPDLFVANCTKQNQVLAFRTEFRESGAQYTFKAPQTREIRPGQQVKVCAGLPIDEITSICEQLQPYGLIAVADIARINRRVVPIIFNVDQPVKRVHIEAVMAHNNGVQIIDGRARREKAAIASNELVTDVVSRELAAKGIPVPETTDMSVEYEQLDTTEKDQVRLEEGYRMDENAPPPVGAKAGPDKPKRKYTRRQK